MYQRVMAGAVPRRRRAQGGVPGKTGTSSSLWATGKYCTAFQSSEVPKEVTDVSRGPSTD